MGELALDLGEFLGLHGSDLGDLVENAGTVAPLNGGDRLIAVGSLAEGLGNRKSDVDLLHVTANPDHACSSPDEVRSFAAGRCVVDLRIIPTAYADALCARLAAWAARDWSLTVAADFSPNDILLLHRLHAGRTLWPGEVRANAALARNIARLKLHVARHMARTLQVDIAGYREMGDARSMVFAGQDLLGHAVDGLLAGFGLTNPTPKWRSRLLDRLPAGWQETLVRRPSSLGAKELFWRLHRAPARPTPATAMEHACRIITFARAVFMLAEERLVHPAPGVGRELRWRRRRASAGLPALPFLELDVDFCRMADGVAIGRLNEFGRTLKVDFHDAALMLLFDNATPADEASHAIGAGWSVAAQRSLDLFAGELRRLDFVVGA